MASSDTLENQIRQLSLKKKFNPEQFTAQDQAKMDKLMAKLREIKLQESKERK